MPDRVSLLLSMCSVPRSSDRFGRFAQWLLIGTNYGLVVARLTSHWKYAPPAVLLPSAAMTHARVAVSCGHEGIFLTSLDAQSGTAKDTRLAVAMEMTKSRGPARIRAAGPLVGVAWPEMREYKVYIVHAVGGANVNVDLVAHGTGLDLCWSSPKRGSGGEMKIKLGVVACPPVPVADDDAQTTGKGIFRRKSVRRGSETSKADGSGADANGGPLRFGDSLAVREFIVPRDVGAGETTAADAVVVRDVDVLPIENLRRVHGGPVLSAEIGDSGTVPHESSRRGGEQC